MKQDWFTVWAKGLNITQTDVLAFTPHEAAREWAKDKKITQDVFVFVRDKAGSTIKFLVWPQVEYKAQLETITEAEDAALSGGTGNE